jgi:ribosomal protein S27AE
MHYHEWYTIKDSGLDVSVRLCRICGLFANVVVDGEEE